MNKKDFPIFSNKITYLDSAATTQKPMCVIDSIKRYYETENANPHRGLYELSSIATSEYESARECVKAFINAGIDGEVIFTKNATESINLVCNSLKIDGEIIVSIEEHHSNYVPWVTKYGDKVRVLPVNEICDSISEKTKLVCVTQMSNVLGKLNDVDTIAKKAHEMGAMILVDGSQSIAHTQVDVSNYDFFVFSGHKLYAPMGIGVLYGKRNILESLDPFIVGGGTVEDVSGIKVDYKDIPEKFEAGTVNVEGAVGLKAAIEYVKGIGYDKIQENDLKLMFPLEQTLISNPYMEMIGDCHYGLVSFNIKDVHSHDVADILGSKGICIRAGVHCAYPLFKSMGLNSACRVSFGIYNDADDVLQLLYGLSQVRKIMGYT